MSGLKCRYGVVWVHVIEPEDLLVKGPLRRSAWLNRQAARRSVNLNTDRFDSVLKRHGMPRDLDNANGHVQSHNWYFTELVYRIVTRFLGKISTDKNQKAKYLATQN